MIVRGSCRFRLLALQKQGLKVERACPNPPVKIDERQVHVPDVVDACRR